MENEILIRAENLSWSAGNKAALEGINCTIPQGAFVVLSGPDGAGKTTFLRLIAALLRPSAGRLQVFGFDTMRRPEEIHRRIGYMPQRFGLYEDLTVQQNLRLYADLYDVQGKQREEAFSRLLAMTRLEPFTKRLAGALSGGMKQKLGLACVLLRAPPLLLLDEPSVGVDPISRRELWDMIQEFHKKGTTVFWSSAYLDEAQKADLVFLLNQGKLLFSGSPAQFEERVQGRVFLDPVVFGKRRTMLSEIAQRPNVEDAVLQGSGIRLLIKGEPQEGWLPQQPRFEDAFIDCLGGAPKGKSALAARCPPFPSDGAIAIEALDLHKRFGDFCAVDSISFQVRRGEIFGLLGPNGAGKSTTFRMLCGLLQPTSGASFVNGVSMQNASSEARSHIGYMAQKFSLYGDLSVRQNLAFFASAYNLTGTAKKEAMDQMMTIFGLVPFVDSSAREIPVGYKQRLALACATMHRPAVLFLDEPTSGVDPIERRSFWNHINGLAELGCTIMVTTHFMDEAEYCDRIGLIYQSKMIHLDTPERLKKIMGADTLEEAFIQCIGESRA